MVVFGGLKSPKKVGKIGEIGNNLPINRPLIGP